VVASTTTRAKAGNCLVEQIDLDEPPGGGTIVEDVRIPESAFRIQAGLEHFESHGIVPSRIRAIAVNDGDLSERGSHVNVRRGFGTFHINSGQVTRAMEVGHFGNFGIHDAATGRSGFGSGGCADQSRSEQEGESVKLHGDDWQGGALTIVVVKNKYFRVS
jgi:hypothetical protein